MTATQPYSFEQATAVQAEASAAQRASERWIIDAWKRYAEAERAYREALSKRIVELKAEGTAVTACGEIARGEPRIAALKYKRDVSEGVRDAAGQGAFRAGADRKAEQTFTEWSMRRDLAEGYHPPTGPADPPTYGRRAA